MDEKELYQLLDKYQKGSLTPQEQAKLDQWYADFDITAKDHSVFAGDLHEQEVRRRLLEKILDKVPDTPKRMALRIGKPLQWAAAVLLLIGGIAFFYHNRLPGGGGLSLSENHQTATAQTGKLVKLRLEDGSEIILNAGSTVAYPKQFAADIREVFLEGEAFFDIAPDADKPFIVKTGKMDIRVLGTSFNVRAHPDMHQAKVTVASGKVSVEADGKTLGLLNPNQEMNYDKQTAKFEVATTDAKLATSWQSGEIRLDGVSFQELAIVIKNTWGLTLETRSERLKTANYKTTFHATNPIDDVMQVIGKITNANYEITDQKIRLYE
jgi:Fe2+-dicitrate sensor, membrane component